MAGGSAQGQKKALTNERIWHSRTFSGDRPRIGESMQSGEAYSKIVRTEDGIELGVYDYSTGKKERTILSSGDLVAGKDSHRVRMSDYTFGPNEEKLLIAAEREAIYRRSRKAHYYVYDIGSGEMRALTDHSKGKQRLASFSPDGSKVAFVRRNNIFIKDLQSGEEKAVTTDGEMNKVIYGATDWVYEEELAFTKGFYWSPRGDRIAFYRFDEAHVKQWQMTLYDSLYATQYKFKFPKAGERNANVSIHVYDLKTGQTQACETGDWEYIPRIKWTRDNDKLCIMRMNRLQDSLQFLVTENLNKPPQYGSSSKVIYEESADTYLEISDDLYFLKNGKGFIWTNENSGYNHIYHYNMAGEEVEQVTSGDWEVTSIKGVDEENGRIYYMSAEESPMERHLYSIGLDGRDKEKLTPKKGTNSPSFSAGFEYFINRHSDANTPPVTTLRDQDGEVVEVLEDNSDLKDTLDAYGINEKTFFSFETSNGDSLNGWMIKPDDFDPSKEYPVFMYVYGGPGINTVNDRWGGRTFLWHNLLADKGYIVVSVDNRGTGYRGAKFQKCTYKELGKLETEDQIEAAEYLAGLDYTDPERIGIQGWSYGGYLTSLCLMKGAEAFSTGIAVAPVTNWRFYDTIYTERYMQTPQENPDGYDENSPINHVGKLEDPFLLVHGSADDNVHLQNTMMMAKEMVKQNVDFELAIYPNKAHGIAGGKARWHLFRKMTEFVEENL